MNGGLKRSVLRLWMLLDTFYFRLTRLQYVDRGEQNIFRVRLLRYRGADLQLSDGEWIRNGDLLLKIHLHNVRLLHLLADYRYSMERARHLQRLVMQSLPALSGYLEGHRHSEHIKGVIGITQLNRGCRQLGFDVYPLANRGYRLFKKIGLLPIHMLACSRPLHSLRKLDPKMLLMSKARLRTRYSHPTFTD